jgi:hypothetical protein
MDRRGRPVPEAAPVVGVVLAGAVALYGSLFAPTGTLLPVVLGALLLLYGFTAFAVVRSDDPTAVLPPDALLAAGIVLAVLVVGYGLAVARQPMFAVFVGLVGVVPPALYHARFGERIDPLDARTTLAAAVAGAAALLAVGVAVVDDPAMAVVDAVLVVLAAADYREARGGAMDEAVETALVSACLGGAGLAVVYFVLVAGQAATGVLVGTAMLVVGAYFVL